MDIAQRSRVRCATIPQTCGVEEPIEMCYLIANEHRYITMCIVDLSAHTTLLNRVLCRAD